MVEEDIESFDIGDNQSVFQYSVDEDDFMGTGPQDHSGKPDGSGNNGLWRKLKVWWYRRRLGIPSRKWQERSIPLYDLDADGVAMNMDKNSFERSYYIPWRRISAIIMACCLIGIAISLVVQIAGTERKGAKKLKFDPYVKYNNGSHEFYPLTVMVSVDGFHPSLISKSTMPFLYELYTLRYENNENVTCAPFMLPSFPTQTFPNHWSIVTGKYPREHHMVSNVFFDPVLEKEFSPGNVNPDMWLNTSEPIWQVLQTAFKHDTGEDYWPFKVATHMWPGSDVNFSSYDSVPKERMPYYFDEFNSKEPLDSKINKILKYIDMDSLKTRPQLILSYLPQVDAFGHQYGYPVFTDDKNHAEFISMLKEVDDFLQQLTTAIEDRNISSFTNLIFVSDHGMSNIQFPENVLIWEDLIDDKFSKKRLKTVYDEGPMIAVTTDSRNDLNELERVLLNSLSEKEIESKFSIYFNGNFPDRFNFNNVSDHRIASLWIVPEPGYAIMTKKTYKRTGKKKDPKVIGSHGYDNLAPEMRSFFIGMGPFFERGYIKPFENVEVFDMLLDIFGVSKNDRFGDVEDTYFYKKFWRNETIETNIEYLKNLYGSDNAYNEIWGDGVKEEEVENDVEHDADTINTTGTDMTSESTSIISATHINSESPIDSISRASTSEVSNFSTTSSLSYPTTSEESTTSSTTSISTTTSHHNWFDDLLEDTKEIIDDLIEDIEDLVKGDNDT